MRFLYTPDSQAQYKSARYVVLPVPYDGTTSYFGGTRLGPNAILDASQHIELFDEELLLDASTAGVFTAEPLRPTVSGPQEVVGQVCQAARPILADGKFLLTLGGEHSITAGLVRAAAEAKKVEGRSAKDEGKKGDRGLGLGSKEMKINLPKTQDPRPKTHLGSLGVLQIDAHSDLRDNYMGSPWSHGCVMRRLHQDMKLPLSPVGIRSFSQGEHEYMRGAGIEPVTPATMAADPAGWIARALDKLPERIYLTIDIDAFDPSYVPGTGTPEPGGMTWEQVTALVKAAFATKQVVAADIVEVLPVPGSCATEYLAARLAYKLITYREWARRGKKR